MPAAEYIVYIVQITRSQCPILYVELGWFHPRNYPSCLYNSFVGVTAIVGQSYWPRSLLGPITIAQRGICNRIY